jgi:hypothetical protein
MTKKKKEENTEILKVGSTYRLVKVWIKKGQCSGVSVGTRKIKLSEIPTIGNPIKGKYDSEHPLSGDHKEVKFEASRPIVGTKEISGVGLRIETPTSVYLMLY